MASASRSLRLAGLVKTCGPAAHAGPLGAAQQARLFHGRVSGFERWARGPDTLAPFGSLFEQWAPFFEGRAGARRALRDLHARPHGIALDVVEGEREFRVLADLPGVARDSIKLQLDHDLLSLEVQRQEEAPPQEGEWGGVLYHRTERSSSFARRAVRVPDSADLSQIKAGLEDGVLTLTIPKKPEEQGRRRTIAID